MSNSENHLLIKGVELSTSMIIVDIETSTNLTNLI